ncbi:major facilitator superfamily domain-containing protein [Lipomyces orientalis]|uniref:Major facilitator superfamily domain-containing protein n=1 Tax=Lipomyces orientalis TaxID=1233043 RepID=A0ACC3TU91_9ASCO
MSLYRTLSAASTSSELPLLNNTDPLNDPLGADAVNIHDTDDLSLSAVDDSSKPSSFVNTPASVSSISSEDGLDRPLVDLDTLYGGQFAGVKLPPKGSPERNEMERRLKLRIDMSILPIVIAMYMLNYLDRNNIAAAKLGSLVEDLNLTGMQYSSCVSILFVSYTLMQIPSNLILEKVGHPSIYLPAAMTIWGMLSMLTAIVTGYRELLCIRFLIGFAEAAFYPGTVFYMSCWYTKYEIAKRSAIFVCGSWISGAFSGLVAYGVLENLEGTLGLSAWRWLFLIEGTITVTVALIAMPILPNLPATTRWLSKEERLLGVLRMIEDVGQQDEDSAADPVSSTRNPSSKFESAMAGFMMAVRDPKVLTILQMMFSLAMTGGINTVFPTIVDSLGFSRPTTLLLTAPPWILCSVTSVINSFHSDKTGERCMHMLWGPCLALLGFLICVVTTSTFLRYIAMLFLLQIYNSWSLGFAWMATTVPRPPIKRAAAVAFVNIGGNIPNIIVPFLFYQGSEPKFYLGFGVCALFAVFGMLGALALKSQLKRLNVKLERGGKVDGLDGSTGFRFIY